MDKGDAEEPARAEASETRTRRSNPRDPKMTPHTQCPTPLVLVVFLVAYRVCPTPQPSSHPTHTPTAPLHHPILFHNACSTSASLLLLSSTYASLCSSPPPPPRVPLHMYVMLLLLLLLLLLYMYTCAALAAHRRARFDGFNLSSKSLCTAAV